MSDHRVVVAADSISEADDRVTTMAIPVPWACLDDFVDLKVDRQLLTVCRIPSIDELLQQTAENPFVPQSVLVSKKATAFWLGDRDSSLYRAYELANFGINERDCRSLLVPFLWRTVVMTAGHWWNFDTPVVSKISPDLQAVADEVVEAHKNSEPRIVRKGEHHLPFIQEGERNGTFEFSQVAREVAVVRCSRGTHITNDGRCDALADAEFFNQAQTGRFFEEIPYGIVGFLNHTVSPFSEEEKNRRIEGAREYLKPDKGDEERRAFVQKLV